MHEERNAPINMTPIGLPYALVSCTMTVLSPTKLVNFLMTRHQTEHLYVSTLQTLAGARMVINASIHISILVLALVYARISLFLAIATKELTAISNISRNARLLLRLVFAISRTASCPMLFEQALPGRRNRWHPPLVKKSNLLVMESPSPPWLLRKPR